MNTRGIREVESAYGGGKVLLVPVTHLEQHWRGSGAPVERYLGAVLAHKEAGITRFYVTDPEWFSKGARPYECIPKDKPWRTHWQDSCVTPDPDDPALMLQLIEWMRAKHGQGRLTFDEGFATFCVGTQPPISAPTPQRAVVLMALRLWGVKLPDELKGEGE